MKDTGNTYEMGIKGKQHIQVTKKERSRDMLSYRTIGGRRISSRLQQPSNGVEGVSAIAADVQGRSKSF
jgi:hypothetical protein